MLRSLAHEFLQTLRALRTRPGFSLAVVVMLALATGITTAMFTVVDALVWRPLPFHEPEQLAGVWMRSKTGGAGGVAPAVLDAWQQSAAFAAAESAVEDIAVVERGDTPTLRGIARVTPGLFAMLGQVQPIRGRLFDPDEGRAGNDTRVLLSEDVWRSLFGADESILGQELVVAGQPLMIVGVLPAHFRFPSAKVELWRPIDYSALPPERAAERATAYVRFSSDMPRAAALRLATAAAHQADPKTAGLYADERAIVREDLYNERAVPLLAGGVVLVFIVLCVNVASLLLSRLTALRREFSMRAALGASRGRLMRQTAFESGVLAVAGSIAGILLAAALIAITRVYLPEAFHLGSLNPLDIDRRALAATALVCVIAALVIGAVPAWLATRVTAEEALRANTRGGTESRAARTLARTMLIGEVALACVLLAGATLLVRSFVNLSSVDRGLDTARILVGWFSFPSAAFADRAAQLAATSAIEQELRALPGIERVVWSDGVPPDSAAFGTGSWKSDGLASETPSQAVAFYNVGSDFFSLYGIQFVRGRTFAPNEPAQSVIVGERWAQTLWPGLDPIGRTFTRVPTASAAGKPTAAPPTYEVIGVVREIHFPSMQSRLDLPEFYQPIVRPPSMLSIRSASACPSEAILRQRVAAASPQVRINRLEPADARYLEQLARPRAAAALAVAFAAVALAASAGGLFSVFSYAVNRRRKEFGIRSAVGASPRQLRTTVLRDVALVTGTGLIIGATGATAFGQALASLQYGIAPGDPVSWLIVCAALMFTALLAAWRPARHAARTDALQLLREE